MTSMALGAQALADLRRRDEAAGIDPTAPSRVAQEGGPPIPPAALVIDPPPWSVNYRPPASEVEVEPPAELVVEETPSRRPPARREPTAATPNLDQARRLRASLHHPARTPSVTTPDAPPRPRIPAPDWSSEP